MSLLGLFLLSISFAHIIMLLLVLILVRIQTCAHTGNTTASLFLAFLLFLRYRKDYEPGLYEDWKTARFCENASPGMRRRVNRRNGHIYFGLVVEEKRVPRLLNLLTLSMSTNKASNSSRANPSEYRESPWIEGGRIRWIMRLMFSCWCGNRNRLRSFWRKLSSLMPG